MEYRLENIAAGGLIEVINELKWPRPTPPDAWYPPNSVKIGYEISFTRHFYKPQPIRTLKEIRADILALESETEGLLGEIIGRVKK